MLFGIYQDRMHQNNGNHLDGGITDKVRWKAKCKNVCVCQPNATTCRTEKSEDDFSEPPSLELDSVRDWMWNSERVIVFKFIILQRDQGVEKTKYICARLLFQLDFSNCGTLTNLRKTHLMRLRDSWGNLAVSKARNNAIVCFRTWS